MEVDADLAADLAKICQLSQDSDGAFDPTLGKLIRLWDIDGENPHVPDQSEIDALLPEVGYGKIQLDGNQVTLPGWLYPGSWSSWKRHGLRPDHGLPERPSLTFQA